MKLILLLLTIIIQLSSLLSSQTISSEVVRIRHSVVHSVFLFHRFYFRSIE